jgi:hypothetical protein
MLDNDVHSAGGCLTGKQIFENSEPLGVHFTGIVTGFDTNPAIFKTSETADPEAMPAGTWTLI